MLHLARKIRGATIHALDGSIGTLQDFYFEEKHWTIRYLLVDTGKWLSGRRVLISPMAVAGPWNMGDVPIALTRDQVWHSPQIDFGKTLSREAEAELLRYYGYPAYWGAGGIWGMFDNPAALFAAQQATPKTSASIPPVDVDAQHLHSVHESTGYHLQATDGEIGHVDDFLIGQESWRIRYLLVDTSNWIGGRSVVVSTEGVQAIATDRHKLHVALTREAIRQSRSFSSIEDAIGAGETGPPFAIL